MGWEEEERVELSRGVTGIRLGSNGRTLGGADVDGVLRVMGVEQCLLGLGSLFFFDWVVVVVVVFKGESDAFLEGCAPRGVSCGF